MRKYRVNADSWTVLRDILRDGEAFNPNSASLRGRTATDVYPHHGRMSGIDEDIFRGHRAAGAIDYVIYSYSTPIAYRITTANPQTGEHRSQWIEPSARYSVTTSKHQAKVRTAISRIGA